MGAILEDILPGIAIGGSIGGGILESEGIKRRAEAVDEAAKFNAALERREGAERERRIRRGGRQEIGRQVAIVGASGVRLEGSPLQLIAANAAEIERQALEERLAGQQRAGVSLMRGKTAKSEARRASAAALLRGGTRAAFFGQRLF